MATVSITRVRAALATAHHHTRASWMGMRTRIAALTNQELAEALELEKLGRRRTEHLKLIDNEIRRRHGDAGPEVPGGSESMKLEIGNSKLAPASPVSILAS